MRWWLSRTGTARMSQLTAVPTTRTAERQGKLRLQKWYEAKESKEKKKIARELTSAILLRKPKMCNFIEYKDLCVVYKRYASLFFCFAVDRGDNELGVLEVIHRFVERYWKKVIETVFQVC